MEDEATDEEKELGAAWTRENILDPLHEEYERYAQAQREAEAKEDPGSNPGWGENDDDDDEADEEAAADDDDDAAARDENERCWGTGATIMCAFA